MGISIFPLTGTVEAPQYYEAIDDDTGVRNGVYAAYHTTPSIDCSMTNGFFILESICGLESVPDGESMMGQVEAAEVAAIYARSKDYEAPEGSEYQRRRLHDIQQILLHCMYHECGFCWC